MDQNDILPFYLIQRILYIKNGTATGSGFIIDKQGNNCVITARHIFGTNQDKQTISFEIFRNKKWDTITGTIYFHSNADIDIAIIILDEMIISGVDDTIATSAKSFVPISQRGFFSGFPLNIKGEDLTNLNHGYPFPLVKGAVFAGFTDIKGVSISLLDGINNPGFSGGPAFFYDRNISSWILFGVVTGYISQPNEIQTALGTLTTQENSGIIICYHLKHVAEILDSIPKK